MNKINILKIFFNTLFFVQIIALIFIFNACNSNINLEQYDQPILNSAFVGEICKGEYEKKIPRVGVVEFSNYTFKNGKKASKILANALASLVEEKFANTGNVELFSRIDLDKIDKELELQDSGLLDENTIVEFGLNAGVEYIVTGSIDYISHDYRNYGPGADAAFHLAVHSKNDESSLFFATVALASLVASGGSIDTKITIRIIDVSTGKVVFSKSVAGEESLSSARKPTQHQIIEVSKKAIAASLDNLDDDINYFFAKKGYITKMRIDKNNELIAKINLGTADKIKQDDKLYIYKLEENTDPLTQKKTCDKVKTNYSLVVSNMIYKNNAWGKIDIKDYAKIKILDIVQNN